MSAQHLKPVYAYRDWEIDLARRELRLGGGLIPIGGRALEILQVLVEAAGDTVNKYDLMERVWPGAVVEENTLQFHISAVRKALGRDRRMLKTVFGRGYSLLGSWTISEGCTAAHIDSQRSHTARERWLNNLPAPMSQLIGRAPAVKLLQDSLDAYRMVTLVGVGGVGKTTLALEVARGIDLAREHNALFWQLRGAVSLARLKVRQERVIEARSTLAPICGAFADETEFSDLGIARELMSSLPAVSAG